MAKAWDNYLSGKKPERLPRENFVQKLRQLVDLDVADMINVSNSTSDTDASVNAIESIRDFSISAVGDTPPILAMDAGDANESDDTNKISNADDTGDGDRIDDAEIVQDASEVIVESYANAILIEKSSAEIKTETDAELVVGKNHVTPIVSDTSYELSMGEGGIEIARWTCVNHNNLEINVAIYPPDTAVLLKMPDDSMMLVYNIGGEGRSHCIVDSLKQAKEMIVEDNESTQELYIDMPEALWRRV